MMFLKCSDVSETCAVDVLFMWLMYLHTHYVLKSAYALYCFGLENAAVLQLHIATFVALVVFSHTQCVSDFLFCNSRFKGQYYWTKT